MLDTFLAGIFTSQWLVVVIVGAILLAASEFGFRIGLRLHRAKDESRKGSIAGTLGAVLGLLGLLLGFTFAMAAARYESRRSLVLQEANAIGTTYLRAAFLPTPHQADVEQLLRRYVDARLDFYESGNDAARQGEAERVSAEIQRQLWAHAVASGLERPTPMVSLFVAALNEVIDLDSMRLNALVAHVPGAVWLLVLAVASCGCWASGYQAGANGARSALTHVLLPLLIAVVITLVADLDRPRGGVIGISQQPLVDLRRSLGA